MNVDDAMEEAKQGGTNEWLPAEVIDALGILSAEVERLKAELAQSRKDWCDDDEAIKQQALRVLDAAKVEGDSVYVPRMGALAEMMADEMERLRAEVEILAVEVTRLQAIEHEQIETQAELAAAKAASRCPARVENIYDAEYPSDCYIECWNGDECMKFREWLYDRIKDKSPPQA